MVEKTVRMNMLFDFYGQLLTERQRSFFSLYYSDDLSLGEIAEHFNVSRQAVYDIVKRSAEALEQYEEQLGLYERYVKRRSVIDKLEAAVQRLATFADACSDLPSTRRSDLTALSRELSELVSELQAVDE